MKISKLIYFVLKVPAKIHGKVIDCLHKTQLP